VTAAELIGQVGAAYLQTRIATGEVEGTARFIIDCLSAGETSAIAQSVLNNPTLRDQFEIKLPAHFVDGLGLPADVLTTERATYFRNSECPKAALLLANTGDDEEQSLKELVPIGAAQLQEQPELWVQIASAGLALTAEHLKWWEKALTGLLDLRLLSLERLAEYVIQTRRECLESGLPIMVALGSALPALRMPRDSCYFKGLTEKTRGHASKWKALYASAAKKRACYLIKQTPSQIILTEGDLVEAFTKVAQSIPDAHHALIRSFIAQPSGWNAAAADLATSEWEEIKPLFDGLRREKFSIGQATIGFYDDRDPELLSDGEREYLRGLVARRTTECFEEDESFYEAHRNELKDDRKLKSVWDRFVFGKARETHDFVVGLALSCEPLFSQEQPSRGRILTIRCDRATKKELKDLNVDAGLYFATRYSGIQKLLGTGVRWDVGKLFDFRQLVEEWKTSKKIVLNRSSARAALQLKFLLELEVELLTGGVESYTTQLVWNYDQNRVTGEFVDDWTRLSEHPLVYSSAMRESMSSKGRFQTVDLFNVKTFVPAYDKDRGSFVSIYKKANDIAVRWRANLSEAIRIGSVSTAIAGDLRAAFEAFVAEYEQAVSGFLEQGLGHSSLLAQAGRYASLLEQICVSAKGDRNRELLLRPLLRIGTVAIEGGQFAAIVAPWHPLRIAAMARKARIVTGLVKYLLTAKQVYFGDTRLYFRDLDQCL
jgi:S-DNA-T family DNA segregation ATPase FtsK/SpoIIIE